MNDDITKRIDIQKCQDCHKDCEEVRLDLTTQLISQEHRLGTQIEVLEKKLHETPRLGQTWWGRPSNGSCFSWLTNMKPDNLENIIELREVLK